MTGVRNRRYKFQENHFGAGKSNKMQQITFQCYAAL